MSNIETAQNFSNLIISYMSHLYVSMIDASFARLQDASNFLKDRSGSLENTSETLNEAAE